MEISQNADSGVKDSGLMKGVPKVVVFGAGLLVGVAVVSLSCAVLKKSSDSTGKEYVAGFASGAESERNNFKSALEQVKSTSNHLNGAVTSVGNDRITIHLQSLGNPFDEKEEYNRTVTISGTTKLYKVAKDSNGVFTNKEITIKDIAGGDDVFVTSSENIRTKGEFSATGVYVRDASRK